MITEKKLLVSFLFITIITAAYFHYLLIPGRIFCGDGLTAGDTLDYNLPVRHKIRGLLIRGEFPHFVKDSLCGFPLFAEGQGSVLSVYNLPIYIFGLPAFNISLFISLLFLLFFSFLMFGKSFGLSPPSSLYAAFVFSFAGYLIMKISITSFVFSFSFLPALFLLVSSPVLLAAASGMIIFGGHYQTVFISYLLVLAWTAFSGREKFPERMKTLFFVSSGLIAGVLAAFVQIAATYGLVNVSIRRAGLTREEIGVWKFYLRDLIYMVRPGDVFSSAPSENIFYVGGLSFCLAVFGIYRLVIRRKEYAAVIPALAACAVIFTALSFSGTYELLSAVYRFFPFFSYFRFPQRYFIGVLLVIAFLVGLGTESSAPGKKKILLFPGLFLLSFFLFKTFCGKNLLFTDWGKFTAKIPQIELLNSAAGENLRISSFSARREWARERESALVKRKKKIPWGESGSFLFQKNILQANSNMFHNIMNMNGYFALMPERHEKIQGLFYGFADLGNRLFGLKEYVKAAGSLSVSHILSFTALEDKNLYQVLPLGEKSPQGRNLKIYAIKKYLPFVSFPGDIRIIREGENCLKEMFTDNPDPSGRFYIEAEYVKEEEASRMGNILKRKKALPPEFVMERENRIRILLGGEKTFLAGVAVSYFPGWRIYSSLSGRKLRAFPFNWLLTGVKTEGVSSGDIVMRYLPEYFIPGIIVTICFMLCLALRLTASVNSKGNASAGSRTYR